jgi:hypothetical protein
MCLGAPCPQLTVAVYGVGAGAVEPSGIGEGASVEPCVFGGFLFADLFEAGVGDGLLIDAVVAVLVPVFPDCSQDVRNAKPIMTAIREITCFFIRYIYFAPRRVSGCLKANGPWGILALPLSRCSRQSRRSGPNAKSRQQLIQSSLCRPRFGLACLLVCFHQVSIAS